MQRRGEDGGGGILTRDPRHMSRMPFVCRRIASFFASAVHLGRQPARDSTFCSKYVTEVLQHIGVEGFGGLDPAGMSPSSVHRVVCGIVQSSMGSASLVATTPYKRSLLNSEKAVLWA